MSLRNIVASALVILASSLVLSACATTGAHDALNVTDVGLSEANYEVVATDVKGEASAGYLLGASGSAFRGMQTFALARVDGTGALYGEALEDLWSNFRDEHGPTDGRELALVNVRQDTDALNLILYTRPKVSIRADVVEFTE